MNKKLLVVKITDLQEQILKEFCNYFDVTPEQVISQYIASFPQFIDIYNSNNKVIVEKMIEEIKKC